MGEQLDTALVQRMIEARGLKTTWVINQIGLKRTSGYYLLQNGVFPKDLDVKNRALEKLAQILGVEVRQILLRLEAKRTAS